MFDTMIHFFTTLHWGAVLKIIAIDILLGGDNAVIIALACKDLPQHLRKKGILWGTAGAIIMRVILVVFAMSLLALPFLKLIGGALLLWIGVKLLTQDDGSHGEVKSSDRLWNAVKTILIADLVMSVDNVIGMAGAAQSASPDHQVPLIIFGLLVSIPIVVWGSQIVLKALEKYPVIISLGGALLGWIGGGLILSDIVIQEYFGINPKSVLASLWIIKITPVIIAEVVGALAVFFIGDFISKKNRAKLV
jgi:YjbE family integral membrane protein